MKAGAYPWFLGVLVGVAISSMALGATTLQVGSGETDLPTIQAAVDLAADGDTIVISPGIYTGRGNTDVDLQGKALTIRSTDPRDPNVVERTVIDCAGLPEELHRGFYVVDCNGVVLAGLTITRGLATAGGAVYCQKSTLELANCRILDNAALDGGAENANGGPGGGIYGEGSIVSVIECLLSGNRAGSGASAKEGRAGMGGPGGGINTVKSDLSVISSTITRNTAGAGGEGGSGTAGNGGDGGGICGDTVRIVDSTISLNIAGSGGQGAQSGRGGRGGGVYADTANLDQCLLAANRAGDEGPAVADANDIRGGGGGDGGAVFTDLLEIANSLIAGNQAGLGQVASGSGWVDHGNGGGLWCAQGAVNLCTITENLARRSEADPNARATASAGRGAGVFMTPVVILTNSLVYRNTPGDLAGFDCNNISYCNLRGTVCPVEDGNDFEDPVFIRPGTWIDARDPNAVVEPDDPNAVWVQGDYHLQTSSPWFDAGDPNYVPAEDEMDLDGNARLADAAVDLGAYESPALVPVYRFWAETSVRHFLTAREAEKDKLLNQYADVWMLEGTAFQAYSRPSEPNLLPVYRFWSEMLGSHFYTIKEAEKEKLIGLYSDFWTLEGTAFYAYPAGQQPAGAQPVYRFWSEMLGSHFFTIKEAEKDKLINQHADVWQYEGIAWYAYEAADTTPAEPNAVIVYELSGDSTAARCSLTLKAYLDGKEVKIDNADVNYITDQAFMKLTVDSEAMEATLNEFLLETKVGEHKATIGGSDAGSPQIPIVLSTSVLFWGRAARGPFGIDSKTLAFPTTGAGSWAGNSESFTVGGSATVDGAKLDVGLVQEATGFATGTPGTFDTSAVPEQISARLDGTFQWSCKQEDLLLETTVKGQALKLYVVSTQMQTAGVWQGREAQ